MSLEKIEPKRWLTPKELQEEYGFGISNQAKLRMDRKIPYSKVGHWIKYDRLEIDKWLESNKIAVI